jgi:O6-methylguanine-DNA--protein-cysteine methyltransferase
MDKGIPIKYLSFKLKTTDPDGREFFERVYQVVRLIPHGRVTSYGAIANYMGSKRARQEW